MPINTSLLKKMAPIAIWALLFTFLTFHPGLREEVFALLTKHPNSAPLMLILCQLVFAALGLPCSPLTVLAGLLWGIYAGALYSMIATLVSGVLTFVLGRYMIRHWVQSRFISGRMLWAEQLLQAIDRYSWKAVILAYANPILPGSSLGYVFGISRIGLVTFVAGMTFGTIPLQLLLVGIGHSIAQNASSQADWLGRFSIVFGLLLTLAYLKAIPILLAPFTGAEETRSEPSQLP